MIVKKIVEIAKKIGEIMKIIYFIFAGFVFLIIIFAKPEIPSSSKDILIFRVSNLSTVIGIILPGVFILSKSIREKIPLFKKRKFISTILGCLLCLIIGQTWGYTIDSFHSDNYKSKVREKIYEEIEERYAVIKMASKPRVKAKEKVKVTVEDKVKAKTEIEDKTKVEAIARGQVEADPIKVEWNTSDLDGASNGNLQKASTVLLKMNDKNFRSKITEAVAGSVNKSPWKYYGQVISFSGKVAIVQEYPPHSTLSNEIANGGECGEIALITNDGTIVDSFLIGSTGIIRIGDFVTIYGLPLGIVGVPNKLGGITNELFVIGKM